MNHYVVGRPIVAIMEEPASNSQLLDEAFYGMEVRIMKNLYNGWLGIRTYYGYEGYVRSQDLECIEYTEEKRAYVSGVWADVFLEPNIKSRIIMTLPRGSIVVTGIKESNGYTEVCLLDGRRAYVKTSQLCVPEMDWKQVEEVTLRKQIVSYAMSYIGAPYRYGGKTPAGIDCSGLCFMAYLLSGIIIYRDSVMKPGYPVHRISKEVLKPGDLIYFEGHVALYIGEDRFVHATNQIGTDGVAIQSFSKTDENYRKDLVDRVLEYGSIF